MTIPLEFVAGDGSSIPLSGKAVLVVNTASACGFTPQYAGLQALWARFGGRGLSVLAVPCNDFGAQEPGGNESIKSFCESRYQVTFPLAAKAQIVDAGSRHPFYTAIAATLGEAQLPRWNFHKFLVRADGELLGAWPSKVALDAPELLTAVESALSTG